MSQLPPYLHDMQATIEAIAKTYGLDFFETVFEELDYKTMNEVAAYGGFPVRYPHWRYGMEYEHLTKSHVYGLSKIYEMVINNDPCYAYLLEGNSLVDQKMVMAHVYGHNDFFKNNFYFSKTNRRMIDGMANHATRVRRHIERIGIEKVETFIDHCLCLDNLIDPHSAYSGKRHSTVKEQPEHEGNVEVPRIRAKSYMDRYINPPEFMDAQRKKMVDDRERERRHPERMERDVLLFLIENAPLERWERDILEIVRDEAYYFAPQGMTKIMNEGWACLAADSLAFTSAGLIPMRDLVAGDSDTVCDGQVPRKVYDRNIIRDHETIRLRTRRGLELCGSTNHRVMLSDGETWKRLDELTVGDRVLVSGGQGLWPSDEIEIATRALEVAVGANVESVSSTRRTVDAQLGSFLGAFVRNGRFADSVTFELSSESPEQARVFAELGQRTFGLLGSIDSIPDGHSVQFRSKIARDLLATEDVLKERSIPSCILRSPEHVVRAFLSSFVEADSLVDARGLVFHQLAPSLSEQLHLVLMNFGVLSTKTTAHELVVSGNSARVFLERIGLSESKRQALEQALGAEIIAERWDDEVVSLEHGRQDVYDISVEETHRYAACGLLNHNSYWHSKILTEKALEASEIIDYSENNAGVMATAKGQLNPYKLGVELYRHVEERWDKGRFGKDWDDCDDFAQRRGWDRRLGLGRKKIFEVRKLYNDVTFIDEFFTEEFCRANKFFSFGFNERSGNYEIETREFKKVKEKLLQRLTNFGQPVVLVEDGNFENRSELLLRHRHEGTDLRVDHAKDTLESLVRVWKRPVNLVTRQEGKGKLMRFDGREHSEKSVEYIDGATISVPK